jgi:hypothetical protein
MKRSGVVLALTVGLGAVALGQDKRPENIDVVLEDADVRAAFAAIETRARRPILVDPAFKGEHVTISLKDIPWHDAVDVIAKMTGGYVIKLNGGTPFVVANPRATLALSNVPVREAIAAVTTGTKLQAVVANDVQGNVTVDFKDLAPAAALSAIAHSCSAEAWDVDGVAVVTKRRLAGVSPISLVTSVPEVTSPQDAKVTQHTLDVDLEGADIREACEGIGSRVGLNIIVEPDYKATVTLHAREIPWWDAIAYFVATTGGQIEWRGSVLVLDRAPSMSVRSYATSVSSLFRLLGPYAGKNLAVGPGASVFAAPMQLSSVRWALALRVAAIANGYDLVEQGPDTVALAPTLSAGIVVDDPTPVPAAAPAPAPEPLLELEARVEALFLDVAANEGAQPLEKIMALADGPEAWRVVRAVFKNRIRRFGAEQRKLILRKLDIREAEDAVFRAEKLALGDEGEREEARRLVARAAELVKPYSIPGSETYLAPRRAAVMRTVTAIADAAGRGRLTIEAIAIDPRPESKDRCIVGGRIYAVGDEVLDSAGRPINGLRIVKIDSWRVRFRLDDFEFDRRVPW